MPMNVLDKCLESKGEGKAIVWIFFFLSDTDSKKKFGAVSSGIPALISRGGALQS